MLDFTQYQIVLTRTLVSCPAGKLPVVKTEATIAPFLVPDGEQIYVIDPRSLISAFKTSDVLVDYKDGRLVGINASTADKTGEVASSVVKTAGKIASLAFASFVSAQEIQFCSDKAIAMLKAVENSKKPIEDATASLDEANTKLTLLTAQYAASPTEKLRLDIRKLTGDIKSAKDKLDALTKSVAAAQAWLTDVVKITWPGSSTVFSAEPRLSIPAATLAEWFKPASDVRSLLSAAYKLPSTEVNGRVLVDAVSRSGAAAQLGMPMDKFHQLFTLLDGVDYERCMTDAACEAQLASLKQALIERSMIQMPRPVSLRIEKRGSYGSTSPVVGQGVAKDGLRYRVPAAGTLYICEVDQPCQLGEGTPIAKVDGPIAQLGTVFTIPFSSPLFASGGMTVKFDDQGRLIQAGLKRDTATALGYANLASEAAGQVGGVLATARGRDQAGIERATKLAKARKELADAEAGLTKTPLEAAQAQLQLMETQQKIDALLKGMASSPTKELTSQIELAKLQADLAEQLERQKADPNADLASVAAFEQARTAAINAQVASKEAEIRLIEADRALKSNGGAQ